MGGAPPLEPATIMVYAGRELIGDGFIKLPFLRALRGSWPAARITWLAGKGRTVYAGALKPLADFYLDEVIEDAGIGSNVGELLRRPLPARRFDLVIDTQRRVLTTLIVRRIRHGSFVSGAADYWLSDARPPGRHCKASAMATQLLELVRAARGAAPVFAATPDLPERYAAAAKLAVPGGKPVLGLVPGAGGRQKCWPRDRYVDLARGARSRGAVVAMLLGPAEEDWLPALQEALPTALFPLQEARVAPEIAASPLFTVAVARRLTLAVANDCGTAHMLAAADCPMISLFGPTAAAKFAPSTPDLTIIRAQDFGGGGMADIPLAAVAAAVERKLAAGPPS